MKSGFTCKTLLFITLLLFLTSFVDAASRYWIASSPASWNNTANWSTSSGGSGGASVPGSGDIAYFNASGNGNCTVNATVNLAGLNITGYSGTISQGSNAITIGSFNYTQTSGTFTGGDANIDLNGQFIFSGGTFTATTATFYVSGQWNHNTSGTFTPNGGTVVFDGSGGWIIGLISNSETFHNLNINQSGALYFYNTSDKIVTTGTLTFSQGAIGSWNNNAASIEAQGNVTFLNTFGTSWHSYVPLVFTGSSSQQDFNLTGATAGFNGKLKINKSSGELRLLSALTMDGTSQTITLSSGTLNLNGQTLDNTSGNTSCDGTFTISGTGTLNNKGWSQTSGSAALTISGASTFTVGSGNYVQSNGTFSGGTSTMNINGSFTLSVGTFTSTSGNLYVEGSWTRSSGTFNHNNGTVIFDAAQTPILGTETFYNLTIDKSGGSFSLYALNDKITVSGDLNLTRGSISSWNSQAVYFDVYGDVTVANTFGTMNQFFTLTFTGSTAIQNFDLTNATDKIDAHITVNKSSGEVKLASALTMDYAGKNLTITSGTFNLDGNNLTAPGSGGSFSVASGANLQLQGGETLSSTPTLNSGSIVTYDGTSGPYTMKNWSYKSLTINGGASSTFNMPANLTVDGDLTITQGILDATTSNYDLTINGDWSNSGTFTARAGTVTFNTAGTQDISGTTTFYDLTCNSTDLNLQGNTTVSNNLVINSSKVLSVDPGKSLTVSGTLTNSGGNAGLVLNSDATGTGALIHSSSISGTVQRFAPGTSNGIIHFLSLPVGSGTGADLLDASRGNFNIYEWTTAQAWNRIFSGTSLSVGKGYYAAYNNTGGNKTLSFTGTLNYTDVNTVAISGTNGHWNLLGNPFTAPLSCSLFVSNNSNINGTIKFWADDESGGSTYDASDYASWTTGGTVAANGKTPGDYIAVGQGFWVESDGGGSTVDFDADWRAAQNPTFFIPDPIEFQRIWLNVEDEYRINNEILIVFAEGATPGFDRLYDSKKLRGNAHMAFYSYLLEQDTLTELDIQGLPLLHDNTSVRLGLNAGLGGEYLIRVHKIENFDPGTSIYLEDKLTQKLIDLRKLKLYNFNTNSGEITDRFVLHFNPEINTSADLPIASPIQIYSSGNTIHLINPDGKSFKVEIYDLLGRNVYSADFQKESQSVQLHEVNACFVVKALSEEYVCIRKILIE